MFISNNFSNLSFFVAFVSTWIFLISFFPDFLGVLNFDGVSLIILSSVKGFYLHVVVCFFVFDLTWTFLKMF